MQIWNLVGCPDPPDIFFSSRSDTERDLTFVGTVGEDSHRSGMPGFLTGADPGGLPSQRQQAWNPWLDSAHPSDGPEHLKAIVTNPGTRQTSGALVKAGERP